MSEQPRATPAQAGAAAEPGPTALPPACTVHAGAMPGGAAPPADTLTFLHTLERMARRVNEDKQPPERRAAAALFDWSAPMTVTRAPGRLDVMGGIADYSGSLVLQMPIAQACHVALQRAGAPGAGHGGRSRPVIRVVSLHSEQAHRSPAFEADLEELLTSDGEPREYADVQRRFKAEPATQWAAYVVGALLVLMRERGMRFSESLAILVSSDVPEGKGVSSSAAVEVATMAALNAAFEVRLEGGELATLCQKVENLVVGAPCGIMDQMASALGRANELLALRCQPAEVIGSVPVPPHMRFWGVDSGLAHSVGGSDYGAVRVGAFMGRAVVAALAGAGGPGAPAPLEGGYLCNLTPSEWLLIEDAVPEALTGAEFAARWGSHGDAVTQVDPAARYAVRRPTEHPVWENHRVQLFHHILTAGGGAGGGAAQEAGGTEVAAQLSALGELMLQSHASYSRCQLGSSGTDRLVALVRASMARAAGGCGGPALFGAKITGGGSGGTVAVLATNDAAGAAAVADVVARYTAETQHAPTVISASSMGAMQFGAMLVDFAQLQSGAATVA